MEHNALTVKCGARIELSLSVVEVCLMIAEACYRHTIKMVMYGSISPDIWTHK